jgi:hypothetical protein
LKDIARRARQAGFSSGKSGVRIPTPNVHKILRKGIYAGEFLVKGRLYRESYQPLVSKELYEQVQDVLDPAAPSDPSGAATASPSPG